ncbi:MAG: DNA topoisomerase IB [Polyangiaceae bacterium]
MGAKKIDLLRDAPSAAEAADLTYVSITDPGYSRRGPKGRFFYVTPDGERVKDARELERIKKLGIPPAWTHVWICKMPDGHIQCVGRDVRGRKQYRYHTRWREVRDGAKYEDALAFGESLPQLRARITRDLVQTELTKDAVVAAALRVMDLTHIRVGNDRYSQENHSYGLTTLLAKHTKVEGATVELDFKGKSGKQRHAATHDEKLAKILRRCLAIPGQRLFRYRDAAGSYHAISSTDVNEYIHRATDKPFTAKEFRTWTATVRAALLLFGAEPSVSATHGKRQVKEAIRQVAQDLGNTLAICKKSYVHPAIVEAYLGGSLHHHMKRGLRAASKGPGIRKTERAVLYFLRAHHRQAPNALEKSLERSLTKLKKSA